MMQSVNPNANSRTNFSAIFIRRYSWVRASMKVTILFGDTADAAAKPQGRLRFSFGSVVSKSAMRWQRCEVAIHAVYITIRHL